MNYYKILQISDKATHEEIELAYKQLIQKWQKVKETQPAIPAERIDNIINSIEQAYQALSNQQKEISDNADTNEQTPDLLPTEYTEGVSNVLSETKKTKSINKILLIILFIFIIVACGYYYFIFDIPSQESTLNQASQEAQVDKPIVKDVLDNAKILMKKEPITTDSSIKAPPVVIQPANRDELLAMAEKISNSANKYRNTFINKNTTFLGAFVSKQNIRLNFKVIEGISISKALFKTYLTERFIMDNKTCKTQEADIKRGNGFIFAYYDVNYNLLASYIIDNEVCSTPLERRMFKKVSDDI